MTDRDVILIADLMYRIRDRNMVGGITIGGSGEIMVDKREVARCNERWDEMTLEMNDPYNGFIYFSIGRYRESWPKSRRSIWRRIRQ